MWISINSRSGTNTANHEQKWSNCLLSKILEVIALKVKNISASMADLREGRFAYFQDICDKLEKIVNEERGTIVQAPEILFVKEGKSFDSDEENLISLIITYIPNTGNGHVRIKCNLKEFHKFAKEVIMSDYPVSTKVIKKERYNVCESCALVLAVWTETGDIACDETKSE